MVCAEPEFVTESIMLPEAMLMRLAVNVAIETESIKTDTGHAVCFTEQEITRSDFVFVGRVYS